MMNQQEKMLRYYRFHARIYQATRWSFLFGRKKIIQLIPLNVDWDGHIIEVGCGTGQQLAHLAEKYPHARLSGVDIAQPMLELARKRLSRYGDRIKLYEADWNVMAECPEADVVLFSYCLTMINPGWDIAIEQARQRLRPDGYIAVVDFHATQWHWFERWMGRNHVRMDKHLLPVLKQYFSNKITLVHTAYRGWWQYVLFIGQG